jgi:hypothetical protein
VYSYDCRAAVTASYDFRVAARLLEGGILEAPPAMVEEIYDWVMALLAAKVSAQQQVAIEEPWEGGEYHKEWTDTLKELKEYAKSDKKWKDYKELQPKLYMIGQIHRQSVKHFQKRTPEKQRRLDEQADFWVEALEREIEKRLKWSRESQANARKRLAELKKYLRPGVKALEDGEEISKKFEINTKGWRYGEELERLVEERVEEKRADLIRRLKINEKRLQKEDLDKEMEEFIKEDIEDYKDAIENPRRWTHITVTVQTKPIKNAKGSWSGRTLTIVLPYDASLKSTKFLAKSIRHELQHFSQSYIAYAVDLQPFDLQLKRERTPGFPSRKIQTPEFRQFYDPRHPYHKPSEEARELQERLREQGLYVQQLDLHALDDVEFYTRLADALEEFNDLLDKGSRDIDVRQAAKYFMGTNKTPKEGPYEDFSYHEFFYNLAKHAPGKWRKAISEFVKAVT